MISTDNDPLKSEKLTSLRTGKAKQEERAAQLKAERLRLTTILHPQFTDAAVQRYTPNELTLKTHLFKGNVSTHPNAEQDQAARKDEVLRRTLAGEPLENSVDTRAQLEQNHRQSAAIEDAIEFLTREIDRERSVLSIQYCKDLKKKETELMSQICKTLVQLHSPMKELFGIKRHLIDHEIGLRGICLTLPDFLGAPNQHSEMAQFLRQAKSDGYVSALPAELR
jgi:hypothetical protein